MEANMEAICVILRLEKECCKPPKQRKESYGTVKASVL